MPVNIKGDDEKETTYYTEDEFKAIETEKNTIATEKEALAKDLTEKERVLKEKNFDIQHLRKVSEMTEEEKSKFTTNELESRKIIEGLQEQLTQTQTALTQKEQAEISRERDKLIKDIVGDDEKLKTQFLEEYKIVNIEEKDADAVKLRVAKTAKILGIQTSEEYQNPINNYWEGEAPGKKDESEAKKKDEFFESGKGRAVMDHLGEPAPKKK